jgi:hypothetical protein
MNQHELRELADAAQVAAREAGQRVDLDHPYDEAHIDQAYARGVEDGLRLAAGDTKQTPELKRIFMRREQ